MPDTDSIYLPAPPVRSELHRTALLRSRLRLPVVRRTAGILDGAHASIMAGHGHDFADLTEYEPGDDVRRIDWRISARNDRPIIRRFERETDIRTQLVIDSSRAMRAVAPSGERKCDIAMEGADLLAFLAAQRGDSLGLVVGDSSGIETHTAKHGTAHMERLLRAAARRIEESYGESTPSALLERAFVVSHVRSLMILVTDCHWPGPQDENTIQRIRARHELVVLRVMDMPMTQTTLGAKGAHIDALSDIDMDGVTLPAYLREDEGLAAAIGREDAQREEQAEALLRWHKVLQDPVTSSADVMPSLIALLRRRQYARG